LVSLDNRDYSILSRNNYKKLRKDENLYMSQDCTILLKKFNVSYVLDCEGCRRPILSSKGIKSHLKVELRMQAKSSDNSRTRIKKLQEAFLKEE